METFFIIHVLAMGLVSAMIVDYRCPNNCMCETEENNRGRLETELIIDCRMMRHKAIPNLDNFRNFRIKKLLLANNTFKSVSIDKSTFYGLTIETLDLSHNKIIDITPDGFQPLRKSLRNLYLDNIGLRFSQFKFLEPLQRLEVLSVQNNLIKDSKKLRRIIPPNLNLIELRIGYNNFTRIADRAFNGIRSTIQVLNLERANLDFRSLNFLSNLTRLKSLYLGGNGRNPLYLTGNLFAHLNLHSLQYLSMKNCEMALVSEKGFIGLESLTQINLSGNELRTVPSEILRLTELVTLDLSYNDKLSNIKDNSFRDLRKLRKLNMKDTDLKSIPRNTFTQLGDTLEDLILSHTPLPGGYFWVPALRPLRSLRKLDISYNQIKHIQNDTFDFLSSLEELDLSGNTMALEKFTDTLFRGVETTLTKLSIRYMNLSRLPNEALATLDVLDTLDASGNKFWTLSDKFFKGIKAKNIILQDCDVNAVENNAFLGLRRPVSLVLDRNNISDLGFSVNIQPHFFRRLSLKSNPLKCDCDIVRIVYLSKAESTQGICTYEDNNYMDVQQVYQKMKLMTSCELNKATITTPSVWIMLVVIICFKITR